MKTFRTLLLPVLLALALPAFAAVSVSSPGNGAYVTTPFHLAAYASNCSNQAIASMGYSLDSSSDTTVVHGTSINASVPAAVGQHTLHVKSWGNQGASCVTDVLIHVTGAASTADGVTVGSPGNGSTLTSPFTLSASSPTCSGQPVAAMSYSVDNNADVPAVYSTSINKSVSTGTGNHVLHVKSWGNQGAGCVANVSVNVTGTATSSSGSNGSSDGISVSSPGNGATVGTPFTLSAGASSCSSQPVSAMGYSLDNSSNTTVVHSQSVAASISTSAGTHTLHVKSWGNQGAGCVANLTVYVGGGTAAPAPSGSGGVVVSSPGNGATVASTFDIVGTSSSCSGQPVSAMAYSIDNGADMDVVNGTSLNASASASGGAHTIHVKSWGNQGAGCVANVAINVGGGGTSGSGPSIPSYAVSVSSLQTLGSWKQAYDTGTTGYATGNMAMVGSPAISGNSRRFVTGYSNGGGERYYVSFGDDTSAQNFVYDAWVYLTNSAGDMANLELDMNQVMANGQTVIYGFQCDGYAGVWDFNYNAGSPSAYKDAWGHSKAPCNVRNWSRNAWHHVQISYSRNSSGWVTYHSVWLDGVQQSINQTVFSAFALGWAPSLVANFQVDGLGTSGSNTIYLDKFTVYRW